MRIGVSAILAALLTLTAGPALAQDTRAPADPLLGARVIDGAASKARLWLRNAKGAVVVFDRATGARTVVAEEGVLDLLRTGGVTVALKGDAEGTAVVDLETGKRLTPAVKVEDGSLLRIGRDWVVFGKDAVLRSDGGPWRREAFEGPGGGGRGSVEAADDGTIYVGFNQGEWGGGLSRLAPGSSRVTGVSRIDGGGLCDGPLNPRCDPVTGVIKDTTRPDCVLAAVGLSHGGLSHGRVLSVCGDKVEVVFSEKVGGYPKSIQVFAGATLPLFGLAASPGGWAAVTYGRLIVARDGETTVTALPPLKPWNGLMLAETDGVILTLSDMNWALSTSGYTPLMIPVTD
jgi:hypothetical protein